MTKGEHYFRLFKESTFFSVGTVKELEEKELDRAISEAQQIWTGDAAFGPNTPKIHEIVKSAIERRKQIALEFEDGSYLSFQYEHDDNTEWSFGEGRKIAVAVAVSTVRAKQRGR